MSGPWNKTAGDVGDYIDGRVGGVQDLSAAESAVAHIWRGEQVASDLPCEVIDPGERIVRIQLGNASGWLATIATGDDWKVEVQITFADGKVWTFPDKASGLPILRVRPQGK